MVKYFCSTLLDPFAQNKHFHLTVTSPSPKLLQLSSMKYTEREHVTQGASMKNEMNIHLKAKCKRNILKAIKEKS